MRLRTVASVVVVTLVYAAALAPQAGSAPKPKYATEVVLDQYGTVDGDQRFGGHVSSPKRTCKVGRKVVVYEQNPDGPPRQLGYTFSDSFGNWYLRRPSQPFNSGVLFAKAPRKSFRKGICRPATSPGLVLPRAGGPVVHEASVKITKTSVKPTPRGPKRVIQGRVSSPEPRCRKGSMVEVHVQDGTAQPVKIGTDKTDERGRFKVSKLVSLSPGDRAFAYLVPKRLGGSERCTAGRSATVEI